MDENTKKILIVGGLALVVVLLLRKNGSANAGSANAGGDGWADRIYAANYSANDATKNANSVVDNATEQVANLVNVGMNAYERRQEQGRMNQQNNSMLWTSTMSQGLGSQFF